MRSGTSQIRLSWQEPATGELREPLLTLPVALGRVLDQMPAQLQGQPVSRIVLDSGQLSRFHALLTLEQGNLTLTDQNSTNGTWINGVRQTRGILNSGDSFQIGPYRIGIVAAGARAAARTVRSSEESFIQLHEPNEPEQTPERATSNFPPACFRSQQVRVQDLYATGLPVEEIDYAGVGAGLGSFIWVDYLRIFGVSRQQIKVIGLELEPYAKYQRLCLNSQIPVHERLRSNSDSCPDNLWGWPSYALREAWHDFQKGSMASAWRYLWQVFAEPTLAETYTPRAGNVFASIDREAARIGWEQMYQYGRVQAIRKTNDGRYAIAYSRGRGDHAFLVTRYLHLATGYPVVKFLPDLQEYRERTNNFKSVVNAYEAHDHVYKQLERQGGTVVIRGRGIVASRIIQRLYEARRRNPNIALLHLMRSPKPQGNKFGTAQRTVENHFEFQPFNWPKACWGGELRVQLEQASPEQRRTLLSDWGGTTTADRGDWKQIVQEGLNQGWYQINFGEVIRVEPDPQGRPTTYIREKGPKGEIKLDADFIIDATGLDGKVKSSPLLDDLVTHYNLPLNPIDRLAVTNHFEVAEMRNDRGRVYAAGAITFGGPYAAVDSFLGLQYSALWAIDSLAAARAPRLKSLKGWASYKQWLKWVRNQAP